jgi:hypothetical protein
MIYSRAPASEVVLRVEKSHFVQELCILFFPTSLMKMSLNFKFLYT